MEPTCNVYNNKCSLHIPPGHERCYHCHGRGCEILQVHFKQRHIEVRKCPICGGSGIVDWVTATRKRSVIVYCCSPFIRKKRINFRCGGVKGCKKIKRWARTKMSKTHPSDFYEQTFYKRAK